MIHQALHGYSKGHELLAASLPLTREQRALLAQLTDLSGPAPVGGFDGYLAGYPIPGDLYVLSRTWYATELPRPGCVWTHSLILTSDVLARQEVGSLTSLFRRPKPATFESYSAEIRQSGGSFDKASISKGCVGAIIDRIYGHPSNRVPILADQSDDLEGAFVAIWNQQWPSLRGRFSFTTGMLGSGAKGFDLLGVPTKNRRLFPDAIASVVDTHAAGSPEFRWLTQATADAVSYDPGGQLREFLWHLGESIPDGRGAFLGLCKTYICLENPDPRDRASLVYGNIDSWFAEPSQSEALRRELFGGSGARWGIRDVDALELMSLHRGTDAPEVVDSKLYRRAQSIPVGDLHELVLRLWRNHVGSSAGPIFDAFYDRCDPDAIGSLPTELAADVLIRRPELGADAEVWGRDDAERILTMILDGGAFSHSTAFGLLAHGDLRLLYRAGAFPRQAWVTAARIFTDTTRPGPQVEDFLLRRLWESHDELRHEVRGERFGPFLKFAAAALEVSTEEADSFPITSVTFPVRLPTLQDLHAELQACSFLVLVGLWRGEKDAAYLISEGFSTVYVAARDERLPWHLWRRLEALLPWHLLEWDRCARLIEGAVQRFVDRKWPTSEFFRTFRTDEEFDRAVSLLTQENSPYLRNLRASLEQGSQTASDSQRDRVFRLYL